jgi:NADH:ubiquinone oxidoreductase subunit 4 (subunit M)
MALIAALPAAIFLPLFPLTALFVVLFLRITDLRVRVALVVLWPQIGLMLATLATPLPALRVWALLTALFYAWRALTVQELDRWIAFIAVSAWSLLWIGWVPLHGLADMRLLALGFSLSLLAPMLVGALLQRRVGVAYAGLNHGLPDVAPRLAGFLVVGVLAAVATPPFPSFFAILSILHQTDLGMAAGICAVWLMWSWTALRLLEGFITKTWTLPRRIADLDRATSLVLACGFLIICVLALGLSDASLGG